MSNKGKRLDEALNEYESTTKLNGGLQTVPLTAQQKRDWDMTRSKLLWDCPAFTHILYTMMKSGNDVAYFTNQLPTAGTDGKHLLVNPEFFFKRSLPERVFILAHEICHGIFNHCGQMHMFHRRGKVVTPGGKEYPYDHQIMNIAMDLVINDMLVESGVGKFINGGLHDTSFAKAEDSIVDVYEKVYKQAEKNGKGPGDGQGGQGKVLDTHLQPGQGDGQDADQAMSGRSEVEWDTAVAAGMASAKAQGKLPGAMERFFKQMLEPEVPWQEKIQSFFARKVGSGSYDWRKPDRRLIVRDIYAPGQSGFGAGEVVVVVDTSGSIGQVELDRFFGEMRGILEDVRPKKLHLVWCDATVHKVDELEEASDLQGLKPHGGGGTDFRPPFDWVEEEGLEPDALVYLTDGYGSFPAHPPKYPVLWGSISTGVKYPWGEVVDVPLKPRA